MKRMIFLPALICIFYYSYSQSVTMTDGNAAGAFTPGKRVHVLASRCPVGTVFNTWTGNIEVEDSFSVSTSFIMPDGDVNLTATYKPAPVWSAVVTTINGSNVDYYFPPGPIKGLITFYHGSGGSASNWFLDEFSKLFVNYAVEEGYAVFATESIDRVNAVWDLSGPESVDVKNMNMMFDTLKSEGLITNATQIYGVGMSDGSMFCSLIANLDSFSASALYCVPGDSASISTTTSPTQWCISNDDTTLIPDMMSRARANYQILLNRGIDAQFFIHYASPVFKSIFQQEQSFSFSQSKTVYKELKAGGVINHRGFITVNPMDTSLWAKYIDTSFTSKLEFIGGELTAAAAEHKFHNYFEYKTIWFFNHHTRMKSEVLKAPLQVNYDTHSIYPNPAANLFNLQSKTIISTISVFNTVGQLVKQFSPNATSGQFSCSDLGNGVYFIRLTAQDGKISSEKVLINN